MANGVVVQFAVFSVLAAIFICLFIVYMRRKASHEPSHNVPQMRVVEKSQSTPLKPIQIATFRRPPEEERQAPQTITRETANAGGPLNSSAANEPSISAAPAPPVLQPQPFTIQEDHNQRILAGISENIRKSFIKPVPTYSPIHDAETPRDTEYVRIKKKIITPHGKVRFSILKDSISTNMLAIFRRACLDWKTPNDLISFLPPYLEPEAEILNNQLLLIGTAGHNEKLAIPIRSIDLDSSFCGCFDFVTDDRTAINTPAVLLTSDDTFEVVSRGVITQPAFLSPERDLSEVKLLG